MNPAFETGRPELGTKDVAPFLRLWRYIMLAALAHEPPEWRDTDACCFVCELAGIPLEVARAITPERAKRLLRMVRLQ